MIAEIVSNGMLTLPNAMAAVGELQFSYCRSSRKIRHVDLPSRLSGILPSLILTIFLGAFGLFTAKLLIDFKLNHPDVHNMGEHLLVCASCLLPIA